MLEQKCRLLEQLYRTQFPSSGCLDFRISNQYMCPKVSNKPPPPETAGSYRNDRLLNQYFLCDDHKDEMTSPTPPARPTRPMQPMQPMRSMQPMQPATPAPLNQVSKESLMKHFHQLVTNPDFQYATNLIEDGACGLKKQFLERPYLMTGGGFGQTAGLLRLVEGFNLTGKIINNLTVQDVIQMCLGKSAGNPRVQSSIDAIKNKCGQIFDAVGNLKIDNILQYTDLLKQSALSPTLEKIVQSGGMVQQLINDPIYNNKQYCQQVLDLFDNIRSVVDELVNTLTSNLLESNAPKSIVNNVTKIQKGLHLCLQMLRYQILVKKEPVETRVYPPNVTSRSAEIVPYDCNDIYPGYYYDVFLPNIGKRSVVARRTKEWQIPEILYKDKMQDLDRKFGCHQPRWDRSCL